MSVVQVTPPFANWKNGRNYPVDPIKVAPPGFVAAQRNAGYSDDKIRELIWRWQFLRRHPMYTAHWRASDEPLNSLFDLATELNPDPDIVFPEDLSFLSDIMPGSLVFNFPIDIRQSYEANAKLLKQAYSNFRQMFPEWRIAEVKRPVSEIKRDRKFSDKKYSTALRVLDALAADASVTEIARALRPTISQESLSKTGMRLIVQARQLQHELTRLPLIDAKNR